MTLPQVIWEFPSNPRKLKKGHKDRVPLNFVVPEARIELARTQGPLDFESSASTNFTTPADFATLNGVLEYWSN